MKKLIDHTLLELASVIEKYPEYVESVSIGRPIKTLADLLTQKRLELQSSGYPLPQNEDEPYDALKAFMGTERFEEFSGEAKRCFDSAQSRLSANDRPRNRFSDQR